MEKLYHDTAQEAFQFCVKYSRRTEFRKLCDILRMHLQHVVKHQGSTNAINLNSPESLQMHVEARLMQLETAISMELWQEAFKTIEDIHWLLNYSKKPPKPAVVANYYSKQSKVYLMAGNRLFHACACHRLFVLSRDQKKNLQQEELQSLATKTVLATLSVHIPQAKTDIEHYLDDDATQERRRRLASLLGVQVPPTRQSLMEDLSKYGMIQYGTPEVQELHHWLEEEFDPLQLCHHVSKLFDCLKENEGYKVYVEPLEDVTIMRLIKQVAQVYESIELSRLAQMAPFASEFRLERAIVHAGKNLNIQVRLDHITRCLHFGSDLSAAQKDRVTEGPQVQVMPSDVIRNQLIKMARALQQAADIIDPKASEVRLNKLNITVHKNVHVLYHLKCQPVGYYCFKLIRS
jgi:translation initiation factor 3 subunit A